MLQTRLTIRQISIVILLLAFVAGAGFLAFWNHHSVRRLGRGIFAGTELKAVVLNVSIPHKEPQAAVAVGGMAPLGLAVAPVGGGERKEVLVRPLTDIKALPTYLLSEKFADDLKTRVGDKIGGYGFSLVAANYAGQSNPDAINTLGHVNINVTTKKDTGGVWVKTEFSLQRSGLYLSTKTSDGPLSVNVFTSTMGPTLYRTEDVEKAIDFQVNACVAEFEQNFPVPQNQEG